MNTVLMLGNEPFFEDASLRKMEHAVKTAVDEIASDSDGEPVEVHASEGKLTATVRSAKDDVLPITHDWGARNYVQIFVLTFACDEIDSFVNEGGPPAAIPVGSECS